MNNKAKLLNKLKLEVEKCKRCPLYKTRTNVVFGAGPANAKLMAISESPGYWEDQRGVPYVGAAGDLLNKLLAEIELKREKMFITNVLKCRPVTQDLKNRPPRAGEIKACAPYLDKQLEIIKPKIICTLGNVATSYILEKFGFEFRLMRKTHGKVFQVSNPLFQLEIIPTYHPAAALRNPKLEEILKKDFKKLRKICKTKGIL